MQLVQHRYGKARVRILKVGRVGKTHSVKELEVTVTLQGDFDASYTRADNRLVVATDSMKNTVNVLAQRLLGAETETFGVQLGNHFLKKYAHVAQVHIHLTERAWSRLTVAGKPHPHSFTETSATKPFAQIVSTRTPKRIKTEIASGVEDLLLLKTTGSSFENFLHDEFTTLPETSDRIFATKLKATWTYARPPKNFAGTNQKLLAALIAVFAKNHSPSVQVTLFQMGEAALKAVREVTQIRLVLPNKHYIPINLTPFGIKNRSELFLPTDDPHGQIEGTVTR